ncbi:type VII secretion protein EccB [Actinospica sp. MGRD01-02]|uniref:Type VII secretion protein EccB n=1 Tax=Actinospica acidithermotolerans TaxID=2828514 RepID=A0A941IGK2_9ACTN|nr:type VII secretion protein EccB [Actinospica acidithermotolerans]MBR7827490.1 type VII secretion protein EccB [Actinospica acidithermotolerans]
MATRKDQLDAFNFARRRMVANLVVPTATGSDEGAPRPVKTFASSIILSALAVVAVMVLGVFKPSAPSGWQSGLAVDSSTGAAYVTQNNQLHAVYNITSARLILGKNFTKYDVPDSTLNSSGVTIGSPVGILGAPEDVPAASNMNLTQWSYCQNEQYANGAATSSGQNYLEIGYAPAAGSTNGLWTSNSGQALIVHNTADDVYLIDGDYKYMIGNDQTDHTYVQQILTAINQGRTLINPDTVGYWVSDAWLNVYASGSPITFPKLSNLGATVHASTQQPGTKVGEYGQIQSSTTAYGAVQTANGVLELSPFAYYLYAANSQVSNISQLQSSQLTPAAINEANSSGQPTASSVFESGTYGSNWPTLDPSLNNDIGSATTANICVAYDGQIVNGEAQLTTWTSATLPYGSDGGSFGVTQSGGNLEAGVVLVKPGYGLIAKQSSGSSTEFLIEDSGFRYPLGSGVVAVAGATPSASATGSSSTNTSVSAIDQLGYTSVSVEKVPPAWVSLLQGGAELNPAAAGESPQSGS